MNDIEKITAGIMLILGAISKLLLDHNKAKKEAALAAEQLQTLKDIAHSNQAIREGQLQQNGKLATITEVNGIRHDAMIRAMNSACKAKPIFPMQG